MPAAHHLLDCRLASIYGTNDSDSGSYPNHQYP
jgi:hypothetical protein